MCIAEEKRNEREDGHWDKECLQMYPNSSYKPSQPGPLEKGHFLPRSQIFVYSFLPSSFLLLSFIIYPYFD
jgi:hypothetical protein